MTFEELGLSEKVLKGVVAVGYEKPTEIQALAIPLSLEGLDVTGRAQTGTGKTAAFALPILTRLETLPLPPREEGHGRPFPDPGRAPGLRARRVGPHDYAICRR